MSKYAYGTRVTPEKSLGEIQAVLKKYGAVKFGYMNDINNVVVGFEMSNRRIRLKIHLLSNESEAKIKQKWRVLLLIIKSKLESIESGVETFDEAFMAHIILPNGQTMAEYAVPQIEKSYESGKMPPLLGFQS